MRIPGVRKAPSAVPKRCNETSTELLCIAILCDPDSEVALLARLFEREGLWKCELVTASLDVPPEPPSWDALLADLSTGVSPREAAARLGTSAPALAVVGSDTERSRYRRELELADGYVMKTLDPLELLIRVRAAVGAHRRRHLFRAGLVELDVLRRRVRVAEDPWIELTSREAHVLGCLAEKAGRWWSSSELLGELGAVHQTNDPVRQYILRLRSKLGRHCVVIQSSRTLGYRMNPCVIVGQSGMRQAATF